MSNDHIPQGDASTSVFSTLGLVERRCRRNSATGLVWRERFVAKPHGNRKKVPMMGLWWDTVTTLQEEFSDLPDVAGVIRITVRLLLAAILGGILGFEREQKGKSAGLRTHMLVALGSALFVLIPQQAGIPLADLSRVLQGLVAGVGFLGAGTIIKGGTDEEVKGLTTAAGIWLTAAIGVAAGLGREATAVLSTLLALVILMTIPRVTRLFEDRRS